MVSLQDQTDSIPLGLVMRVETTKHEERALPGYLIVCKDFRTVSVFFLHPESLETMNSLFKHILFPPKIRYHIIALFCSQCNRHTD
jgi:hypothetical protein